ncbi:MAG: hypothetical protein AAGC44_13930 [Planctomycetota bacterium]
MADEQDPYELNDDPFADQPSGPTGDAGSGPYELEASDDLDELAAAVEQTQPRATWGARPPALGADGRLDEDITCQSCGYNLRGQDIHGNCSECGSPIAHSLSKNNLRFADPGWLRSVYTGASVMAIGTLCLIPLGCVAGMAGSAIDSMMHAASPAYSSPAASPVSPSSPSWYGEAAANLLVAFGHLVVGGFGAWKLCRGDPARLATPSDPVSRKLGRALLLPAYAGSALLSLFYFVPSQPVYQALSVLDGILLIPLSVGFIAMMVYLRQLALRIPDESLASQTRIVMWGLIGSTVLIIPTLVFVLAMAFGPSGAGAFTVGGLALGCFVLLGLLTFGIWWIVLLFRFRSAFEYAIRRSGRGY